MQAVIFEKASNKVVGVVKNVQDFDEKNIDNRLIGLSDLCDYILTPDDITEEPPDDFRLRPAFFAKYKLDQFRNIKAEEARKKEIKKRLSEIDKDTESRTIREFMLAQGFNGFNNKVLKAENEAKQLRQELSNL